MKKIYKSMCVICALVLGSMSLMANHNDYSGQYLGYKSGGKWTGAKIENGIWCYEAAGNHLENLTITPLSGTEISYSLGAINMGSLKSGEMAFAITWEDSQYYRVKMTKISVMGAILGSLSNTDSCRIGEGSAVGVQGEYHTVYYENQDGIEKGVKLTFSRDAAIAMYCWIKEIHIDFEVYPLINIVEPQAIDVTLDETKPVTCDLTQCASFMQDGHMDVVGTTLTYSCDNANVKITEDNKAYATAAGEYMIKVTQSGYTSDASDPKKTCHAENVDSFKLVVNRVENAVVVAYGEEQAYDTLAIELYQDTTIDINFGAINPAAVLVEQTAGETYAQYNEADSTITTLTAGPGEAMFRFYQEQTDVYEAAEAFIKVNVKKRVYNCNDTVVTCAGDSVEYRGVYYKEAGTYNLKVTSLVCDSNIALLVVVNPTYRVYVDGVATYGETVSYYGGTRQYVADTVGTNVVVDSAFEQTVAGCDSVLIFRFTISKADQTIAWSLELAEDTIVMNIDGSFSQIATATSGVALTYDMDKTGIVTIENNVLTAIAAGTVKVTPEAAATKFYNAATGDAKVFVVNDPSGIKAANADAVKAKKMMVNGQMIIIRNGQQFNALGAELR